jgi:hypothetical protein
MPAPASFSLSALPGRLKIGDESGAGLPVGALTGQPIGRVDRRHVAKVAPNQEMPRLAVDGGNVERF